MVLVYYNLHKYQDREKENEEKEVLREEEEGAEDNEKETEADLYDEEDGGDDETGEMMIIMKPADATVSALVCPSQNMQQSESGVAYRTFSIGLSQPEDTTVESGVAYRTFSIGLSQPEDATV
ncbi:hypothetical protein PoB_004777800 [Plakobranchus ocellatus]|uniref:Uncharacterized protein n=1 Tax=Plakobranchus ocellatus TaxID=259542 RepID=A0AAV4BQ82_9GAST|nr:hypothetical protein PoB_004777800 [Plakobranchus ocellatus]